MMKLRKTCALALFFLLLQNTIRADDSSHPVLWIGAGLAGVAMIYKAGKWLLSSDYCAGCDEKIERTQRYVTRKQCGHKFHLADTPEESCYAGREKCRGCKEAQKNDEVKKALSKAGFGAMDGFTLQLRIKVLERERDTCREQLMHAFRSTEQRKTQDTQEE